MRASRSTIGEAATDDDGSAPDPGRAEGKRIPDGVGQGRDAAEPGRQDRGRRAAVPRHPRATRRPSSPRSRTRSSPGTTCCSSACAARPRRGCSASSSTCSTTRSRSSPARRSTTTPSPRSRSMPATWSPSRATTRRSSGSAADRRYHEKLATPDVTIADLIGEVDMIKHAEGRYLSSELTMHFGLIPRTNRGIFCINELPDLSPKIQVGLFNVLEERDVQIRGYPDPAQPRPLHGLLGQSRGLHQSRPDRHPAQGPDRLGRADALSADPRARHRDQRPERLARPRRDPARRWRSRSTSRKLSRRSRGWRGSSPHVNQQSGVSVRMSIANLENVVSNAERRAIVNRRAGSSPGSRTSARPPPARAASSS